MLKKGRCTRFELDEIANRCIHYGGDTEVIEGCYYNCKKRKKKKKKRNKLLDKCITGFEID